ncbi:MAG: response regulator transcription factor [Pseudoclavibacter sp.]|nr:response regulator transcription factor [Pseudoclavibacter sp.]
MTRIGQRTIRVLVVDDHPVVRSGLAGLLADEPGLLLAGEAASGAQALRVARAVRPDVVLMDLRMPGMDGAEATKRILAELPATRVLVITSFESDEEILAAVEAGAEGYLLKEATGAEILRAVRRVAAGQAALAPRVAARLLARTRAADGPRAPSLSPRELEVLGCVATGASNRLVGRELGIGEETVKTHLSRLFAKLGVHDRTRAVTRAMELGLLPPPG